ncbi:hypothetical protein A2U01_0100805, partial [Trifolium medium]|nr:hypothetical protein [Trifolium medium]
LGTLKNRAWSPSDHASERVKLSSLSPSLKPGILGFLWVYVAFSRWSEEPSDSRRFLSLDLAQRPRQDL